MLWYLAGKGSEDKRGQAVVYNGPEKSWLYLAPVVCTRHTEVAAMVTSINPAISSTADSLDMAVLQQVLSFFNVSEKDLIFFDSHWALIFTHFHYLFLRLYKSS